MGCVFSLNNTPTTLYKQTQVTPIQLKSTQAMDTTPQQTTPFKPPRTSNRLPRMSRCCFTLNNYTEQEYLALQNLPVKWLIIGKELGENGTPHLQGAFVIGKQVAFSTVKTWPGLSRAHLEPMRGTPQDSLAYCSKQDLTPYIIGTLPSPGNAYTHNYNALFVTQAEIDDFLEWSQYSPTNNIPMEFCY